MKENKNRILALIDGYNYYHKLKRYQKEQNQCVKWLDYRTLIEKSLKDYKNLELQVIYFSAIAKTRGNESIKRHSTYIEALQKSGVEVVLGEFKEKAMSCCPKGKCSGCQAHGLKKVRLEEKNTDVNIAIKLLEYAIDDKFDDCYLLSEDNDFVTVVKRVKERCPDKRIVICPPPQTKYKVDELVKASGEIDFFRFGWKKIKAFQFNNDYEGLINPWKIEDKDKKNNDL